MFIQIIFVIILCLLALWLGWLLTEHPRYALMLNFPDLDRKPFNCRPCLTFHITWLEFAFITLFTHSLFFLLIGIMCGFILFLGLYLSDQNRIDE